MDRCESCSSFTEQADEKFSTLEQIYGNDAVRVYDVFFVCLQEAHSDGCLFSGFTDLERLPLNQRLRVTKVITAARHNRIPICLKGFVAPTSPNLLEGRAGHGRSLTQVRGESRSNPGRCRPLD